tara:strand:+ start:125 stop:556 length:432 start_codon:yes stop_codon:yes gene_type:complete
MMQLIDATRLQGSGQPNLFGTAPYDVQRFRKFWLDHGKSRGEMFLVDRPYSQFGRAPLPYKYDYSKDPRGFLKPSEKMPQKIESAQAPAQTPAEETASADPVQMKGRVPTARRKKRTTIMADPLATESQGGTGTTYRKRLLGG